MWACALGHREAAERLCRWDRRALAVPDTLGRLPLALARARGHLALVTRLEELQVSPVSPRCHLPGLRIPSPLSASPDTGMALAPRALPVLCHCVLLSLCPVLGSWSPPPCCGHGHCPLTALSLPPCPLPVPVCVPSSLSPL